MSKQVILTADDFGACGFINEGIYEAIQNGRINTVSAMVTHQTSKSSIEDLLKFRKENNYKFNIGLHFSISSGYSRLFKSSSLTDSSSGNYHYFKLAKGYKFNKINLKDIEDELIAQLKTLDEYLGDIPIDHVTNHDGITYIDFDFYIRYINTVAGYRNGNKYDKAIPVRSPVSWLKSHGDGIVNVLTAPTAKQGIKLGMSKKFFELTKNKLEERKTATKNLNIACPDYLVDIIYGQPGTGVFNEVMQCFDNHDFSTEYMFHLGKGNDDPNLIPHGINPIYLPYRKKELSELLKWDLNGALHAHNAQIAGYNNI